jgi:hypothetical protein
MSEEELDTIGEAEAESMDGLYNAWEIAGF